MRPKASGLLLGSATAPEFRRSRPLAIRPKTPSQHRAFRKKNEIGLG